MWSPTKMTFHRLHVSLSYRTMGKSSRYAVCEKLLVSTWESLEASHRKRTFLLGVLVSATTLNDVEMLDQWLPIAGKMLDQRAIEEAMLQTLLFAGFPKTIEALAHLRTYYPEPTLSQQVSDHKVAGHSTSGIIYGKYQDKLKQAMDQLHPDLTRWMIEDGYGRVLSRPGLDLAERELCVLASLMATGMLNQFRAHLRGARYAGVPKVDILWFTNTFQCIIAPDLSDAFEALAIEMLAT